MFPRPSKPTPDSVPFSGLIHLAAYASLFLIVVFCAAFVVHRRQAVVSWREAQIQNFERAVLDAEKGSGAGADRSFLFALERWKHEIRQPPHRRANEEDLRLLDSARTASGRTLAMRALDLLSEHSEALPPEGQIQLLHAVDVIVENAAIGDVEIQDRLRTLSPGVELRFRSMLAGMDGVGLPLSELRRLVEALRLASEMESLRDRRYFFDLLDAYEMRLSRLDGAFKARQAVDEHMVLSGAYSRMQFVEDAQRIASQSQKSIRVQGRGEIIDTLWVQGNASSAELSLLFVGRKELMTRLLDLGFKGIHVEGTDHPLILPVVGS